MATVTSPAELPSFEVATYDFDYPVEIVDGQLRERPPMGAAADQIGVVLASRIQAHSEGRLGLCFSGHCGYQGIFPHDPKRLRFPDVSFVKSGRLPDDKPPRGHMEIAPDLIAEVVSPNDNAEDVEQRLMDFLKAGVTLAWVIYPGSRQVYIFRQGPDSLRLGEGDMLDGEGVLPGFSMAIKDLFASI